MSVLKLSLAAAAAATLLTAQTAARAQVLDAYVGQLQQFGTDWCPEGWARADGSVLPIAQHDALFALLGTTFGGDGVNTFGLPDLRDRAPTGFTEDHPVGTIMGQASVTLLQANLPAHSHGFNADPTPPATNSPANSMLGVYPEGQAIYAAPETTPDSPMATGVVAPVGGSEPVSTQSPVLATNWCIALEGIFPQRP